MVLIQCLPRQQQQEQQQQLQPALFLTFHPPDFKVIWGERSCCAAIQATTVFHFSPSLFSPASFFFCFFFKTHGLVSFNFADPGFTGVNMESHIGNALFVITCGHIPLNNVPKFAVSSVGNYHHPAKRREGVCSTVVGFFFERETQGPETTVVVVHFVVRLLWNAASPGLASLSAWMDVCLNMRSINTRRLQARCIDQSNVELILNDESFTFLRIGMWVVFL